MSDDIPILIWIDPDIDNRENEYIKEELFSLNLKNNYFNNINDAMTLIKTIKFKETNIVIIDSLFFEFLENFKDNIKDMYIIPKIIIFSNNKEKFIEDNKNFKFDESFYSLGGIQTSLYEIKNFIINPVKEKNIEKDESQLTFEYIDCKEKLVLPMMYQSLIEIKSEDKINTYTNYLFNKFAKNNENIKDLFNSIKSAKNIPMELLSKYYARLYTLESDFYKDINLDLRENKKDVYLTYIKILYQGVKLKSLPLASDKILYRGSKITNNEIALIKKYLKEKLKDLPGAIVFSKSFLSFSKDIEVAKKFFLKTHKENTNLSNVLFIVEKDNNLDYSLSTHSDIEKISIYHNEKEVLFFPFSSFEIKELKEKYYEGEKVYEIELLYLGKYLKEVENIDKNIPESNFKLQMINMGLIPEKKMEKTKEVIKIYKEYKFNINKNSTKDNEFNIIYNTEDKTELKFLETNLLIITEINIKY